MPTELPADLLDQALSECPQDRVLLITPWETPPLPDRVTHLRDPAVLPEPGAGRDFGLALAAGVLERLEPEAGGALLATLRDLRCERLWVGVPATPQADDVSAWRLEDMLAHGFEAHTAGTGELALYRFDIDRYKNTPDWLNARNWANPENWGRYRW